MPARIMSPVIALSLSLAVLSPIRGEAQDPAGEWEVVVDLGGQPREYLLELKKKGDGFEGALVSPRTKNRYPAQSVTLKDQVLRMEIPREFAGQQVILKVEAKFAGEKGNKLDGSFNAGGLGEGKFSATRKSPPAKAEAKRPALAGRWSATAKLPDDREMGSRLEIREASGKLSGAASSERGSLELKSLNYASDGAISFSITLPAEAGGREYVIQASFEGTDRLKGKWSAADGNGSGDWIARRELPPGAMPLKDRYRLSVNLSPGKTGYVDLRLIPDVDGIGGHLVTEKGRRGHIRKGSFKEGKLELEADVRDGDEVRKLKISGSLTDKGRLKGTWSSEDASGEFVGQPAEDL